MPRHSLTGSGPQEGEFMLLMSRREMLVEAGALVVASSPTSALPRLTPTICFAKSCHARPARYSSTGA
jgi:hypothetical protein